MLSSTVGAKETEVRKTGKCLPSMHLGSNGGKKPTRICVAIITVVIKCAQHQVESDVGGRERKRLF